MGLIDLLFGKRPQKVAVGSKFETFTAYQPVYRTWQGGLYESELVRSAIDAKARHISKLKVETFGTAKPGVQVALRHAPNEFQTWGQFLYRLSTILDLNNSAFIVPVRGDYNEIVGLWTILPSRCEIVDVSGSPWLRYTMSTGKTITVPVTDVGIMTRFQYMDDFFGTDNHALYSTMDLVTIQKQGIEEAIKNATTYRFMARMNNFSKAEDLARERKRFTRENLASDAENGGLLLFPNTYTDIKQIQSTAYTVDAEQMKLIQTNVFNYFGVSEEVLQNRTYGDAWSAFYEGAVEPFAVQFSDVVSRLLFSQQELTRGSGIIATANRLQYLSNADKLSVSAQMADRGIMSINEIREIWNLPPVDGGDVRIMRGEYKQDGGNSDDGTDETDEGL